ncbi:Homoserine dehydrogenase [bacterium HR11]|nr:Homoserine dehydrogenase [bacterium HR11]
MTVIGMLGCGTVGTGFLEVLKRRRWHEGRFQVRRALVTDPQRERWLPIPVELTDRPEAVVSDPDIQVVVDVLPDSAAAYGPVVQALENRKAVLTANRALVAEHGLELEQLALRQNVPFLYRAALLAGVPAAVALREYTLVSPVRAVCGVLHRAGHVVLTAMTQGQSPEDALQEMAEAGYVSARSAAEPDGREDLWSLVLLVRTITGAFPRLDHIRRRGLQGIEPADLAAAQRMGFVIKPLIFWEETPQWHRAIAEPMAVPGTHPLAHLAGYESGLLVWYEDIGPQLYVGLGGGALPTAAALVADLLSLTAWTPRTPVIEPWQSYRADHAMDAYLLRFVLARQSESLRTCVEGLERANVLIHRLETTLHESTRTLEVVVLTEPVPDQTMVDVLNGLRRQSAVQAIQAFRVPAVFRWDPTRVFRTGSTPPGAGPRR